jgi:hypothetical protein
MLAVPPTGIGERAATQGRLAMIAQVGDRIVLENVHLGDPRRVGVVTEVTHPDGTPPYQVRWLDNGHTTLIFPGAEARIEHPAGQPDAA